MIHAHSDQREVKRGRSERWLAVFFSVLVHAGVAVLLGWGFWHWRAPKPTAQALAIEATVVTSLPTVARAQPPSPPALDQAVVAARQEAQERESQAHETWQRQMQQREAEERAAQERRRTQEAAETEARAAAQARAEAQAKADAQARAERDATAVAMAVTKDNAKRQAELRAQMASEERIAAARGSKDEAAWIAQIAARVNRAWIRPSTARPGLNCEVEVTQVPGGAVTAVQIGRCNGDQAVRESIEAAVYRASPLPTPANPDVFDRNLRFSFRPDE